MSKGDFSLLCDMLQAKNFQTATSILSSWNRVVLAEFCQKFPTFYEIMKADEFAEFWQKRRGEVSSKYPFKAQSGVCDADLTIGHTFYLMAHKEKKQGCYEAYEKYLSQALKYYSFHAAETLVHEIVTTNEKKSFELIERYSAAFFNMEALAKRHLTPGYLMLANGYSHLLNWLATLKKEDNPEQWQIQFDGILFALWKLLYLAKQAENVSQTAIDNAYCGFGLAGSNPFELATIDEMIEQCSQLANNEFLRLRAKGAAVIEYKQFSSSSLWSSISPKTEQDCGQDALRSPKS